MRKQETPAPAEVPAFLKDDKQDQFFRTNVANNNTANGPWFGGGGSPTNFTGSPTFCLIANTAPPFAVPSNFDRRMPVHLTAFVNCSA